jgi:predicted metal-dependent hydrolase
VRIVQLGGDLVEVHVRRSARVRGSRAVFRPGEPPEIVVRAGASERAVDRAIAEHRAWLERRLAEAPRPSLRLEPLAEAEARRRALRALAPLVEAEAAALGTSYRRLSLSAGRSRWGSCSSKGALSFNWRLALAPPEVLDYVAVHEVCHLRVPNHSQRFWALVKERRPAYREPREWLKRHGWELLAYRPAEGRS